MNKKLVIIAVVTLVIIAGGAGIWAWQDQHLQIAITPKEKNNEGVALTYEEQKALTKKSVEEATRPGNEIATSALPSENILLDNKTQHYTLEMPKTWFAGKTTADLPGVDIYNKDVTCKIATGFITAKVSLEQLIDKATNDEPSAIKDIEIGGAVKYQGKEFIWKSGAGEIYNIVAYFNVNGGNFSIGASGDTCDQLEKYFNDTSSSIRFN